MNVIDQSVSILNQLGVLGCEHICLCPGGRNAPFVEVLSKTSKFKVESFFDERSAGFYALGVIKKTKKPVAVITTSGTAVAELLPAVIEAFYSGLSLIVVSADRPKSYRGSGAPQSIEQSSLFSDFAQPQLDLEGDLTELSSLDKLSAQPVHINICFDEPLLPKSALQNNYDSCFSLEKKLVEEKQSPLEKTRKSELNSFLSSVKNPLIILSAFAADQKNDLKKVLLQWKAPIYAEAHSGLQNDPGLSPYLLQSGAGFINQAFAEYKFDSVVRIGGVPTLRLWRNLEKQQNIKIINFSDQDFTGLSWLKTKNYKISDLKEIDKNLKNKFEIDEALKNKDQKIKAEIESGLNKYRQSEQNFVRKISENIPEGSNLFLGNSLPIREWDFSSEASQGLNIYTSRGTNGIDGLLSTFFGLCGKEKYNYCLLGDLSALYDLNAPWIYKKYLQDCFIKIIIINNGGGKIFSPLFNNPLFENNHNINFEHWAAMFGLSYQSAKKTTTIDWSHGYNEVIEIFPDNEHTLEFSSFYQQKLKEVFNEKI